MNNSTETISVAHWFDINDIDHLKAHLQKNAAWPEGFIPDHVTCNGMWQIILTGRMSAAFVAEKLAAAEKEANTLHFDLTDPVQSAACFKLVGEVLFRK
jgi:hypothetical protein